MRKGFEHKRDVDQRKLEAPSIPYRLWDYIDIVKGANRGWFVIDNPTIGDLQRWSKEGLFKALDVDNCPVRITHSGGSMNFSGGITDKDIARMIEAATKSS